MSPEEIRAAYIEDQTEIQRRYIENVAKLLEPLLTRLSPHADPARRMEDLRDSFASAAMNGMCIAVGIEGAVNREMEVSVESVAADAYKMADAMLKARSRGDEESRCK